MSAEATNDYHLHHRNPPPATPRPRKRPLPPEWVAFRAELARLIADPAHPPAKRPQPSPPR